MLMKLGLPLSGKTGVWGCFRRKFWGDCWELRKIKQQI